MDGTGSNVHWYRPLNIIIFYSPNCLFYLQEVVVALDLITSDLYDILLTSSIRNLTNLEHICVHVHSSFSSLLTMHVCNACEY